MIEGLMKTPITLSIIIPAYNEEEHIKACVDAIARQTVMPDEVIVVDNNCTDKTVTIAKSFKFVRVVNAKKQGIVYSRDAGLNAAKSMYIGRIDADSVLPPHWVKDVLEFYADTNNAAVAMTGGGFFYNAPFPRLSRRILSLLAFWVNRVVLGHHFLFGSNMVIPRSTWQSIRGNVCIRTDIHEDIDIAIHVHDSGTKIVYKPRLIVGVKLRRVFQDQSKLWATLMLWPQSLKVHGRKLWFTGWIGAVLLYALAPLLYPLRAAQIIKQKIRTAF